MDDRTMIILTLILIVFGATTIYSNIKLRRRYKKEGIETILVLDYDEKTTRMLLPFVLAFILFASIAILYNTMFVLESDIKEIWYILVLPIVVILLYYPMAQKTRITTLGIIKKNVMVPWELIKRIEYEYSEPNKKGKIKAQVFYDSSSRENKITLRFAENDTQFPIFKQTAAEQHRINRKKKD